MILCLLIDGMVTSCYSVYASEISGNDIYYPVIDVFDATVWPIQDTPFIFAKDGLADGVLAAGTPAKIVAEQGEYFYVRVGDSMGFVLKSVCMINLPDIMQEEVKYNITNAYSSIFRIHRSRIKGVTGEAFYPYVKTGRNEFLVPLLYPVALKLYEAENTLLERGYTFKIYDAYRPNSVTKDIYSRTEEFIEERPVYKKFITDGGYNLHSFLARGASNHNYGVALDLTLINLNTDKEVVMQTAMHELSPLAATSNNTGNANMLAKWMKEFGFTGISSEWWHFEIRSCRLNHASFQVRPYEER